MNKPDYITNLDWELLKQKYQNIEEIKEKLDMNYPVQYLIGNVNFYGYDINVRENVLIPRFETEGLIEETIRNLKKYNLEDVDVLEFGTGTGCISIVLNKELPNLKIKTIDISDDAIKLAEENIDNYKLNIDVIKGDIFNYDDINKYSLIISNPPYISYDDEVDEKIKYEPELAIFADNNGHIYYEQIIANSKKWLKDKSLLAFEIGYNQGNYLIEYSKKYFPNSNIYVKKDLYNRDRYLFIINE